MNLIASVSGVIAVCALSVSANVASTLWGYRVNDTSMVSTSEWASVWQACSGLRQSPVDIVTTVNSSTNMMAPITFSGSCPVYNMIEPPKSLEADVTGGNCTVSVNNATYHMVQFHVHAPSEHTVNGKQLDGEIHFVHKSSDGQALLVVGLFLMLGPTSDEWLNPVLDALEHVSSTEQTAVSTVNLGSYSSLATSAAATGGIYNYPGSLTTPPCNETVDWWVVKKPIIISSADFNRVHLNLVEYHATDNGRNARPTQPLNGRVVTRYHKMNDQ
ncbi:hypothetical protein PsorP6_001725 [Peronosclerospora sorghi]|uniref:Uncharacterized protein n=1 Tax=Peronosclerospora sorghi TaxID=230839 RepID=A0ACC0WTX6_9STRA|nr:hypothetical protein PsorP6_001725 [Peronosclerospora sorghi]